MIHRDRESWTREIFYLPMTCPEIFCL